MMPDWLQELNESLEEMEIPEFYLPSRSSLQACYAILPRPEAQTIHNAALFANGGSETAAERCRVAAGYGGLSSE